MIEREPIRQIAKEGKRIIDLLLCLGLIERNTVVKLNIYVSTREKQEYIMCE
jgi:hypothetical protein